MATRIFEQYLDKATFHDREDFEQNYHINVPENYNFAYDTMDELARRNPDGPALLYDNPNGDVKNFTFADIKRLSDKAANYFSSLGLGKGDKVLLTLKRHYQYWYCQLALHKIGAVAVPAMCQLTAKDFQYRLNAAGISAVIATADGDTTKFIDEAAKNAPTLKAKLVVGDAKAVNGWQNLDAGIEAASEVWKRPTGENATHNEDMMLLYFTSGTTGMPKMAWHDYTYPLAHILTASYWQQVQAGKPHLTISDTGWAKAAWGKFYGQWLGEACVFVYDFDRFQADDILKQIEKHQIVTLCAPPTMYRFFVKMDLTKYSLSSLEHCCSAGEALNSEVIAQWKNQVGLDIYEAFGQTETIPMCITASPYIEPIPGAMGVASPGWRVVLVDDDGLEVGTGQSGEVCVRTDKAGGGKPVGLFCGYYNSQSTTDEKWHDDLYHTGDMAYRDENGYFWYVGRSDDIIKASGYRIGPFEVESALMEHPAVMEAAVTGFADPERGYVVKATIVLAPGYEASDDLAREIQDHVKRVTAPYKYPRIIEFVDELPKTISGKIRRMVLREADENKKQS